MPEGQLRYFVGAFYEDEEALVPYSLTMEITGSDSGVFLAFDNADGGGSTVPARKPGEWASWWVRAAGNRPNSRSR
jgi:hypothetical protein